MQYCTFYLGKHFFGVNVTQVQEVIRYQKMTRVPLAQEVIQGLINLRGQIVTALDLRRRLKMPERADGKLPMNVVVRSGDSVVSLLVDEISDVVEVQADSFEEPPETLDETSRGLITGSHKLAGKLLLVLDTDKVVQLD